MGKLCFFEMELLKSDLFSVIYHQSDQYKLPIEQILKFLMNITSATKYLHYKQVCHRDVKPQNIFVAGGVAKLGDFGLVVHWNNCTDVGGTPEYLPYDVWNGDVEMPPRCDIWGVGCVLHPACQFILDQFLISIKNMLWLL